MEDSKIIELYFLRDEAAIEQTREKYGSYCYTIAYNILRNNEDSEECVSDTYLAAWGKIPPQRPQLLSAFLGKITRNLSLKKYRLKTAQKRGGSETALIFEELNECIPSKNSILDALDAKELAGIIDRFLRTLKQDECYIFLRRYWYFDSIDTICKMTGCSKGQLKMRLLRIRKKLLLKLRKEGHI